MQAYVDHNAHYSPAFERLIAASNDIAFKVLFELVEKEGLRNMLISPLSISFALCMLYNGAAGSTRQALEDLLTTHGSPLDEINEACLALRSLLSADGEDLLKFANAIWAHSSLHLDEDFTRTVKQFYGADARSIDFNQPSTPDIINKWAMEQTDGKIYPLLSSDDISAATECVMAAAVYFKGAWTAPFELDATHEAPFYLQDGHSRDVLMMRRAGRYQFRKTPEFQAVGLPYDDGNLSMFVFLPSENSSSSDLLQAMDTRKWEQCVTGMKEKQLILSLPRFKLTYEVELKDPLAKLGLGEVFADGADFSPMGLGSHYIEKFKHKTMVEVNEEGTEAAAVSAVMLGRSLAPSLTLSINRPFVWTICDNRSRALIFLSLVLEPEEGKDS